MRCDTWMDEVQNLLIFVKSRRHDGHSTFQIASRLDERFNSSAATLAPLNQMLFVPDALTIRVNIFWFISLFLSLTIVLFGIVSLQWLRVPRLFRFYSDLSPREEYDMRAEGLKKWHVDKIFSYAATAAMRIGLVPRSYHPRYRCGGLHFDISHCHYTSPLSSAGIPLQWSLSSHRSPPSQCPYKSSQFHAICVISCPFLRPALAYIHVFDLFLALSLHLSERPASLFPFYSVGVFTRYLYQASLFLRWIDYDGAWLSIRDAYIRCLPGLGHGDVNILPPYHIVDVLLLQSWQKSSTIPAYCCFHEISELIHVEERCSHTCTVFY
ncbi:hypothetical protein CVT25_013680 [Psilocybe cyanescens]|uniref:DUF6535 domain-containing protein n=1 Tax=Psilocybe cyanescens TaxID=93625 RepID=A0A409XBD5_PSICY|nr:hypothetical protein CVT25_013680 [Psilocybe cyanescens]